ncbi:MAG: RNA polymerase sigma-54 factor [Thermonema sp.]|uniref:RNA polymerase factor sigma-54 n=1 Tax=Thermonema sp. TaxID=2231181 RepID=UPI0021DE4DEF|nr:RNA polymerase factor sigma-54 [Thermonema sp.]GIV39040.1 MAG: RNA polymerase sigma-54 factor [Thermonema sp.]
MQKLDLKQIQTQKLSPQQIQYIKLLQIPSVELEARVQEELASNPLLEEGPPEEEPYSLEAEEDNYESEELEDVQEEISIEEYLEHEDVKNGYSSDYSNYSSDDDDDKEVPIVSSASLLESLERQIGFLDLDEKQQIIARQIIGSLDNDGYLRRDLKGLRYDLMLTQNMAVTEQEIEEVLKKVQSCDPPGIAARDLKECLMIQLERKLEEEFLTEEEERHIQNALLVLRKCFNEFKKKHYDKIQAKLHMSEEELREAIHLITKLNPKPGEVSGNSFVRNQYIIPDFIVKNRNGQLEVSLNSKNAPELRINRVYAEMLQQYEHSDKKDKKLKETISFVKQKLDSAKWFIDAIKQRQDTLLRTMNAIVEHQKEFFLEGDESKLKPMILKDIADKIGMDISTVSRVASSKTVQTDFGIYPLKYFFSEGIGTQGGGEASSREVKHVLKELVDNEDKSAPYSDEKLEELLRERGYKIARRTVAKYREQLGIPVARLRKEL